MKIFIIDLESVPTRYTCQWKNHLPRMLERASDERGRDDVEVINIDGGTEESHTTPGAFLDFANTNIYKNNQLITVAQMFSRGEINPGDQFIFADAWHPGVIQLKYMSELLRVPITIHSLWHAGSYDSQDFLGRLIEDKRWSNNFEKSVFWASDYNWYATQFHIDMFENNVFQSQELELKDRARFHRTGWPMEYMTKTLEPYKHLALHKRNLILFPHRLAPEKQPDLFRDLAKSMPEYEWVICQEHNLSKHEYHKLLGEAKIVFSANLQETLGISCFEGAIVGAMPLVPNMLSYTEMYDFQWKYPAEWILTKDAYEGFGKKNLQERIHNMMAQYGDEMNKRTDELAACLQKDFFSANELVRRLFDE